MRRKQVIVFLNAKSPTNKKSICNTSKCKSNRKNETEENLKSSNWQKNK